MSWFGPCPEYGYPDYCPPYEVQEAPFKNPESLSKAQKRLVRLAQEKVVDQIICGDDERRLAGWQIMHVTIKNHAHQPGRYELVSREVWDEEFDAYWELVKKIKPLYY